MTDDVGRENEVSPAVLRARELRRAPDAYFREARRRAEREIRGDGVSEAPLARVLLEVEDADGRPVLIPVATNAVLHAEHRRADDQRIVLHDGYLRVSRVLTERAEDGAQSTMQGAGTRWVRVQEERG